MLSVSCKEFRKGINCTSVHRQPVDIINIHQQITSANLFKKIFAKLVLSVYKKKHKNVLAEYGVVGWCDGAG